MAIARYGRYVTGPEQDFGYLSDGNQQACVYDTLTQALIVYQLGAWLGIRSGTPKFRIFAADVTGDGAPGNRRVYTAEQTAATTYVDITGGRQELHDVTPTLFLPGRYSLGLTAQDGQLGYSMRQAAAINAANKKFYSKSGLATTIPTNPVGGSPSTQGHMSIWMVGEVNVAPNVPNFRTPFGDIVGSDLTPQLEANFADENETLPNGASYDYLNQVHIQLRVKESGAVLWDHTYTATSSERNNRRSSIAYSGSALTLGTEYEWRIRHSDRAGAWSNWSSWLAFTIAPAGVVSAPSSPSGFLTDLSPEPFEAVWNHPDGLSTNAARVQLTRNGVIMAQSAVVAKSVAPGGTISISWAETGWAPFTGGQEFDVQMRAKSTDEVWSSWSAPTPIRFNAAPRTPTNPLPSSLTTVTSPPLISIVASDPDPEHPPSALTVTATIQDIFGDVTYATREMDYNATTGRFEYQIEEADLDGFAIYRWYATASDGFATSGASYVTYFSYVEGPVVTITDPTPGEIVPNSQLSVAWTVDDQVRRQVNIYDADMNLVARGPSLLDDWQTSGTKAFTFTFVALENETDYYVEVGVEDSLGIQGFSDRVPFRVEYPPATQLTNVTAEAVHLGYDTEPTAVLLRWNATTYTSPPFRYYEIGRTPLSAIGGDPIGQREVIAQITMAGQTVWLDAEVPARTPYRYDVSQVITELFDTFRSVPVTNDVQLAFSGVVLGLVTDPEAYHIALQYSADGDREGDWNWQPDVEFYTPLGMQLAIPVVNSAHSWDPSGAYFLLTDPIATSTERYEALKALAEQRKTICYRDSRGERTYVFLSRVRVRYQSFDYYEVDLTFRSVMRDIPEVTS